MGLLGEVTNDEVTEALKPPAPVIYPADVEFPFIVDKVSELKSGPKGDYYTVELVFESPDFEKRARVYHTVSLSPGARAMVFKFLATIGINPAEWDDPSELLNCTGRAVLKIAAKQDGTPKNEVKYFKIPKDN